LPAFVPYILYALERSENLTVEFTAKTYLYDPKLSFLEIAANFFSRYFEYFSPSFLLWAGDRSTARHHTGFGGEFLFTTVILVVLAAIALRREPINRFRLYLFLGVLVAPVSAALTNAHLHSLRSVSMSVFIIMLSGYGMRWLKPSLARATIALTVLAATAYTLHYFTMYPPTSAVAFENAGFSEVFSEALDRAQRSHGRVVLSNSDRDQYINLRFFGSVMETRVPLVFGSRNDLRLGDVFINVCDDRTDRRYGFDPFPCVGRDTRK
jgi:hypothetical protein